LLQQDRAKKVIYPPAQDVYSFTACPLSHIKVVILGQGTITIMHNIRSLSWTWSSTWYDFICSLLGLCFSVRKGVPPPPSLVNIYKELASDLDVFHIPKHGYLHSWTLQGVLLLNASLTVEKGAANSHSKIGWEKFTDAIIHYINKHNRNVVFLLWGANAQKKGSCIDKASCFFINIRNVI
jgi:uracil-DNA glycosylase